MISVEEICKALLSLDKGELTQIKSRCVALMKLKETKSANTQQKKTLFDYLKDSILFYAGKLVPVMPKDLLEKNDPGKSDSKLNAIVLVVEKLCYDLELDRRRAMKLCKVLVECSFDEVKNRDGSTPSFGHLINVMADPLSLLNDSFPGYVGTSLFKTIVLK